LIVVFLKQKSDKKSIKNKIQQTKTLQEAKVLEFVFCINRINNT